MGCPKSQKRGNLPASCQFSWYLTQFNVSNNDHNFTKSLSNVKGSNSGKETPHNLVCGLSAANMSLTFLQTPPRTLNPWKTKVWPLNAVPIGSKLEGVTKVRVNPRVKVWVDPHSVGLLSRGLYENTIALRRISALFARPSLSLFHLRCCSTSALHPVY